MLHPADPLNHLLKVHQSAPGIIAQIVRSRPRVAHNCVDQFTQTTRRSPSEHELVDFRGSIIEINLIGSKLRT